MVHRRILAIVLVMVCSVALGADDETSKRLDAYTYIERTRQVTVLLNSHLAHIGEEAHMPIRLALGVTDNKTQLSLYRESFVLVDAAGNEIPLSAYDEVDQGMITAVKDVDSRTPLDTGNNFLDFETVGSNFYPIGRSSGTNHLELRRRSFFSDIVYFPRAGIGADDVLTLRIGGDGLTEPLEVRFRLEPPKKSKGKKKEQAGAGDADGESGER